MTTAAERARQVVRDLLAGDFLYLAIRDALLAHEAEVLAKQQAKLDAAERLAGAVENYFMGPDKSRDEAKTAVLAVLDARFAFRELAREKEQK